MIYPSYLGITFSVDCRQGKRRLGIKLAIEFLYCVGKDDCLLGCLSEYLSAPVISSRLYEIMRVFVSTFKNQPPECQTKRILSYS